MSKTLVSNQSKGFIPMRLQDAPEKDSNPSKVTVTTTIKGSAATEFEKLAEEYGLNRSQLLTQMIYHCLGKTHELKDFYRRLVILGEQ